MYFLTVLEPPPAPSGSGSLRASVDEREMSNLALESGTFLIYGMKQSEQGKQISQTQTDTAHTVSPCPINVANRTCKSTCT